MITTLENVKTILGIPASDTSQDAYLNLKLRTFESYIVRETNNDFIDYKVAVRSSTVDFVSPDRINFTNRESLFGFFVGDQIKVLNSYANDGFYNVVAVDEDGVQVEEQTIKAEPNDRFSKVVGKVVYPEALLDIMALMFGRDIANRGNIKRRKEGNVDIQYNTGSDTQLYPAEVSDFISDYRRMVW